MTQEEKAQAYDKAIEVIRKCETDKYGCVIGIKPSDIFQELQEPEDERVRKALLVEFTHLQSNGYKFAGLEGEKILAWLEKQGEQKPTDNVETRFKVGDWVVFNNKHQSIYQVEKIEDGYYILRHTHGGTFRVCVLHDESLRLWDIAKDAKDGDLIYVSTEDKGIQAIFHEYKNKTIFFHCYLCSDFAQGGYMPIGDVKLVYPLQEIHYKGFFEKMQEAGYEWDDDKKELKKIEQKPTAWSEEDEKIYNRIYDIVHSAAFSNCEVDEDGKERGEYAKMADLLKSIKEIIQSQPKQEWSKEDSPYYDDICEILINLIHGNDECINKDVVQKDLDWFTSLIERYAWKPSDEQMDALETAVSSLQSTALESLYQKLKKL